MRYSALGASMNKFYPCIVPDFGRKLTRIRKEVDRAMNSDKPFYENPPIETMRVRLREMTEEDAADVYAYCSDPEVARYTTWYPHASLEDSRQFVDYVTNRYRNHELAPWAIEDKSTGQMIGTAGFVYVDPRHARAELAYALSRDYWNKGIMSEIALALIHYGFETLKLARIEARCIESNAGSYRVMEKCGMTFEGIGRKQLFAKGKFQDLKMYAIVNDANCLAIEASRSEDIA